MFDDEHTRISHGALKWEVRARRAECMYQGSNSTLICGKIGRRRSSDNATCLRSMQNPFFKISLAPFSVSSLLLHL